MNLDKFKMIALDLMRWHGIGDWAFEFQKVSTEYGACWSQDKKLTFDPNFVEGKIDGWAYELEKSEEGLIDVILHEIAHAIAPVREKGSHHSNIQFKSRGKRLDHGPAWRFTAIIIGCYHALEYPSEEEIPA